MLKNAGGVERSAGTCHCDGGSDPCDFNAIVWEYVTCTGLEQKGEFDMRRIKLY